MSYLEQLEQLIADYKVFCVEVKKSYGGFSGLFGFGSDPKRDSGHMQFYNDVAKLAEEIPSDDPELAAFTSLLLKATDGVSESSMAYGFLEVIQKHAIPLIPFIKPDERKELLEYYSRRYPKYRRLPVQNDVFKELKR